MPGTLPRIRRGALQPWIVLSIAVLISFSLMASSDNSGPEIAREKTAEIIAFLATPFGIFPAILHLNSENVRLRADNVQLMIEVAEGKDAVAENKRLRNLLSFKEKSKLKLLSAEVIADNPLPGVHSVLIDIGRNSGAKKHMAVINDRGLVGKLVQTSDHSSIVQVLLDRNLGAAVRLSTSRVNGITSWAGNDRLYVENIPELTRVTPGEEVITSGLDGIFPEGIPVGTVEEDNRLKESLFRQVVVEPAVDFSRLEELFVVFNNSTPSTP